MKRTLRRLITLLLLLTFVSYQTFTTLCVHTHTTPEGTITHSHPFAPGTTHTHTEESLETISQLCSILLIVWSAVCVANFMPILLHSVATIYCSSTTQRTIIRRDGRAPPVFA